MKNSFTLENYKRLLQYFQKKYTFYSFKEFDQSVSINTILLRHDIDYSLKHAVKMAEIEASLGIKSTYFLLFSSPFYNILDDENIDLARKITQLGHDVGLHYDVSVISKGGNQNIQLLFDAQIKLLSILIENPVSAIAMHNPSISGRDIFKKENYLNVYHKNFTEDIAYFSDSCMAWRENFVQHLENNNFPTNFQLLIHPIFWSDTELDRYAKIDAFKDICTTQIENHIEFAKKMWRNHSGVIEHDLRELNGK
jgi:hypothetical protein